MAIESLVYDDGAHLTNKLMELTFQRQNVIANNLANANTPGFTRQDVDFQDRLAEIIDNNELRRVDSFQGELVDDKRRPARLDGNNVDGTGEMSEMMQNSVLHHLLTKAYTTKMQIMEQAITK